MALLYKAITKAARTATDTITMEHNHREGLNETSLARVLVRQTNAILLGVGTITIMMGLVIPMIANLSPEANGRIMS